MCSGYGFESWPCYVSDHLVPVPVPLLVSTERYLIVFVPFQGATIKRIMEDTETKITVSSINEINSFNMERVITIRGSIDQMSKAEAEISSKLRAAFESDIQAMVVSWPHQDEV